MSTPRITREMLRDGRLRSAAAVLGASVIVLVLVVVGAVRVGSVEAAAPNAAVPDTALRFASALSAADIGGAVARDLFADDRQAPPGRYRLPGEAELGSAAPSLRPVVLGTAVSADGTSFAMCQVGPTEVVKARVGGRVGDYTVVAIARARVTFRGADGERFTVDASKPAP